MSEREPHEILAAFGRDLRAARPSRRRPWRRVVLLVVGVLAAGGATAAATSPLWGPAPRRAELARPTGAPVPDAVSSQLALARGSGWRLTGSACRFGAHETVALFITVPGGGAGRRCDALPRAIAAGPVPPPTLFTPAGGGELTLLFGAVPAGTTRVQAVFLRSRSGRAELREFRARPVRRPWVGAVFVARVPRDVRLLTTIGLDARGRPTVRCDPERCR
jgi:hypothetical protein